jgi:hypothetical protein
LILLQNFSFWDLKSHFAVLLCFYPWFLQSVVYEKILLYKTMWTYPWHWFKLLLKSCNLISHGLFLIFLCSTVVIICRRGSKNTLWNRWPTVIKSSRLNFGIRSLSLNTALRLYLFKFVLRFCIWAIAYLLVFLEIASRLIPTDLPVHARVRPIIRLLILMGIHFIIIFNNQKINISFKTNICSILSGFWGFGVLGFCMNFYVRLR